MNIETESDMEFPQDFETWPLTEKREHLIAMRSDANVEMLWELNREDISVEERGRGVDHWAGRMSAADKRLEELDKTIEIQAAACVMGCPMTPIPREATLDPW